MKYIRTKDGRIIDCVKLLEDAKKNRLHEDDLALANAIINEKTTSDGWKRRVEKVADSVEELCDTFVMFKDGKPFALVNNNENNREMVRNGTWNDLRGAIWVTKGLIYVAKANDKGELELI